MDDQQLRREGQRLLRSYGPLPATELARLLAASGSEEVVAAEADADAEAVADAVADADAEAGTGGVPEFDDLGPLRVRFALLDGSVEGEEFLAYPLSDGRLCDLEHLVDGLTLTHVITEEERATGSLDLEPDLPAMALVGHDGRTFPLAAGGVATFADVYASRLTGPDGWLPAAPVVVVRIVDGRLELSGLDAVPPVDPEVVDRLSLTFDRLREPDLVMDDAELLVETRARYPLVFSSPQAPLGDLLAEAGIRSSEGGTLDMDDVDLDDDLDDLIDHLYEDHGFGEAQVETVLGLKTHVQRLVHALLQASIAQLRAIAEDRAPAEEDLDADDLARVLEEAVASEEFATAGEQLSEVLAGREMTAAIVEDVVETDPMAAHSVLTLLDTFELPRDRAARANAAWLRGRVLELIADDHAEAERELRRATELDDRHAHASFDLVRYLSDRGQAGAALSLLRRLVGPQADELAELLSRYAKPGPTSAGRNEPCPCGSGRKHKVCCQARGGWPLHDRLEWVWDKVMTFLTSPLVDDRIAPIARAAGLADDPEAVRDVLVANAALFEGGLLVELCDRRGSLLPADELELLREWSHVRAGAYELVETGPGGSVTVLDLSTGDRVTFVDRSLARDLTPGIAVLGWLVPEPDGLVPSYGVVRIPDNERLHLLELLDDHPTAFELALWYRSLFAPPRLATTAGDPMVLTTHVYEVPDREAARAALAPHLEADDGDSEDADDRTDDRDRTDRTDDRDDRDRVDGDDDDDHDREDVLVAYEERDGHRWIKGQVTIREGTLTVSTTSTVRAVWFDDLIAEVLPEAVLVDVERIPADELTAGMPGDLDGGFGDFDDFDDDDDLDGEGGGALDLDALGPEERRAVEAQMDAFMVAHEDAWVDTPLPLLGGATPREAVDDPTRRDDLHRLLDSVDRMAAGWSSPGRPMDAARLRNLLGL